MNGLDCSYEWMTLLSASPSRHVCRITESLEMAMFKSVTTCVLEMSADAGIPHKARWRSQKGRRAGIQAGRQAPL